MSDQTDREFTQHEGWQPLTSQGFQQFNGDEGEKTATLQDANGPFTVLYSDKPKDNANDGFVKLYSNGEKEEEPEEEIDPQVALEEELAALREQARKQGYAAGEAEGRQTVLAEGTAKIGQLQNIIDQTQNLWPDLIKNYEQQIVQLICRAAEKIVYGTIDSDQEVIRRTILNALEMIPEPVEITISVSHQDYEYIEAVKDDFFETIKGLKHMAVIADPSVSPGGCHIATQNGEVDATIETRLEAVRQSILEAGGRRAAIG